MRREITKVTPKNRMRVLTHKYNKRPLLIVLEAMRQEVVALGKQVRRLRRRVR